MEGADPGLGVIGQVAINVTDVPAAEKFYGEALGLAHLYTFGDLAFFDAGGVRLLVEKGKPGTSSIVYFLVTDIQESVRGLAARGIAMEQQPRLIASVNGFDEWMAFFRDPAGNMLALMSRVAIAPKA